MEKRQETSKTPYSEGQSLRGRGRCLQPVPWNHSCRSMYGAREITGAGLEVTLAAGAPVPSPSWGMAFIWPSRHSPGLSVVSGTWSWPGALAHAGHPSGAGSPAQLCLGAHCLDHTKPGIPTRWSSWSYKRPAFQQFTGKPGVWLPCCGRGRLAPQWPWSAQSIGRKVRKHFFKWDNYSMSRYSTVRPLSKEILRTQTQSLILSLLHTTKGTETHFPVSSPVSAT